MPIYEYACEKCQHLFELFQGFDAPTEAKCERCSGKARRLISRPAVLFKGSGFHVTDYHRSGAIRQESSEANGKAKETKKTKNESSSKPPDSSSAKTDSPST